MIKSSGVNFYTMFNNLTNPKFNIEKNISFLKKMEFLFKSYFLTLICTILSDALIAADRLFEIIDLEIESSDLNKVELTTDLIDDIHFNNVHFRYGTRAMVFEGLSLTIKKGSSTGIIGESGSGKSTLLSLLQNLYPLKEGNITIGGLDLQYISNKSLRKAVSVYLSKLTFLQVP